MKSNNYTSTIFIVKVFSEIIELKPYNCTVVSGTVVQWYSGTLVQWYSGTMVHCSQNHYI